MAEYINRNRRSYRVGFMGLMEKFACFFADHVKFILAFFFMNAFTMCWSMINEDKLDVAIGYGFLCLLASFVITGILERIPSKMLRRILKGIILAIFFIPFFIEAFTMYNYSALIGVGIINSLLETNQKEAVEFLKMYVGLKEIFGLAVIIALVVVIVRAKVFSRIQLGRRTSVKLFTAIFAVSCFYTVKTIAMYPEIFYDEFLPLQRICVSSGKAVDNMRAYHRLKDQLQGHVNITKNDSKIKNIVFILGESTNRNHMHLYGYYLPNTPYLDEMAEKGDIAVFRDVVSPHSTTIAVLSKLFTFCDNQSDKPWYEYANLIDVMNAAGYKTFWLSNQESSGIWGNVAQIYADHSSMHRFTRIRDSREDAGIVDGELLPLIDEAQSEASPDKNFYVVHLMGGHGLYYNRFPYSFTKFTTDDIQLDIPDAKKEVIAQYDNALYYNDYVVKNIIDKFRDSETLVIYLPDHGEAVYDDGGFNGHIEENPNRHMIEIPMIIWASDSFKEKYADKWEQIQEAVNRPYMSDILIHTILDIADIETPEYDPAKSIINRYFDSSRPRIFDKLDYDKQIATGIVPEGNGDD